jgi:hypothetical protein
MICPTCHGKGLMAQVLGYPVVCADCNGSGVASCCDAAGSSSPGDAPSARDRYRDDRFAERQCDCCGKPYRGPAVYCSLECAIADA